MKVIEMCDNNFVEEINIAGNIRHCCLPYQAKKFYDDSELKFYTDFLDKRYSPRAYRVLNFTYQTN